MTGLALIPLLLAGHPDGRHTPVVDVAKNQGAGVVNINAEIVEKRNPFRRGGLFDDFFRDYYQGQDQSRQSLGSGVIIDESGVVLTNEHVISRASAITVTLRDRRTFAADVVGADASFDLAVLRLRKASDLPVVKLGTSADLMPGETVIAIGNPFGLSNTVTTGVISALHRSVPMQDRVYEDFIQTDAAINPGNSGGALLNINGELIGINTAIYGGDSRGIGFAIPVDKARAVLREVMLYGEVRPVDLGLLVDRSEQAAGAVVTEVSGAAAQSGIQVGDKIVDLGGQQVDGGRTFARLLRSLVPKQKVKLAYRRGNHLYRVELTAGELSLDRAASIGARRLGLSVRGSQRGLEITRVERDSDAARVGVRAGDGLWSLAGRRLRNEKDLEAVLPHLYDAESVAVVIGRRGRGYYVTLRLN